MSEKQENKIRVLHIITRLIVGGAQQNTILTVAGLQGLGDYELTLLSGPQTGPEGSLIEEAAASCKLRILPELRRNINPYYDLIAFIKLIRFIKKSRFDIIHTHSSKAGILGRWAARLAGKNIIVHTVHGWGHHDFQHPLIRFLYISLEKLTLLITHKLIGVSKVNIENGLVNGIGKVNNYSLIRSGIDLERFKHPRGHQEQLRSKLGIPPGVPVVGTVTRLSAQKAPLDFIRACAIIAESNPEAWFVIVGDGPLKSEAESLTKKLALEKRLVFTGLRDDVPELMSLFNIFALSSLWEGLPRVLPQAMARGLPIVATNIDGNAEAVINEENGLLVAPGDYKALAQSILSLLDKPQTAALMGKNGFKRVEEFAAQKMIKEIDSLYKGLLSCGK
ncbi:MAG: glycosyltransferase family 4 protein [Candidatus Omnitrophica bacterium]|nr:glycosyltransferase family 4 protein [Candidatus Omnitrophota bacterium]